MTIKRARTIFSIAWIGGTLPLVILIQIRMLKGFYLGDWTELLSWVTHLVLPGAAVVISSWFVTGGQSGSQQVSMPVTFWGGLILSTVYVFLLYAVVLFEPAYELEWTEVFRLSGFYLGLFQGLVLLALGKFYIENH